MLLWSETINRCAYNDIQALFSSYNLHIYVIITSMNREFRDGERLILCRIQCLRCVRFVFCFSTLIYWSCVYIDPFWFSIICFQTHCRPHGIETLPKGIISRTSDLEIRSLSGPENKKVSVMMTLIFLCSKYKFSSINWFQSTVSKLRDNWFHLVELLYCMIRKITFFCADFFFFFSRNPRNQWTYWPLQLE